MSKHSNNLQKWISKNESQTVEELILQIEKKYPLELVVAFTESPALVPVAAARMIALLAVAAELLAEMFWWPVPAWALGLFVFAFLLFPVGRWQAFSLFRVLARRSERHQAVSDQADNCFTELGLARTHSRNALLLFFNMKERIFLLRPDRTLQSEWPELRIEEIADQLRSQLQAKETPAKAASQMLERVAQLAEARWPNSTSDAPVNELPNAIAWWKG
jgi:uncharacterized membrane protein